MREITLWLVLFLAVSLSEWSMVQTLEERHALRSLLHVQCEAVVSVDAKLNVRSDGLDSLMEVSMMDQPIMDFLPNEEEQARVTKAFQKGKSSKQVILLPTTFIINGETVSVDLFIVYRASLEDSFLVGIRCLQENVPAASSLGVQIDLPPDLDDVAPMSSISDLSATHIPSGFGDLGSERGTERVFEVSALQSTSELVKLGLREHWIIEESVLSFKKSTQIAQGSFGKVRTASFCGAEVAVKEARRPLTSESSKKRALLELRVLRHLRHPNIIEFLGACIHSGAQGLKLSLVFPCIDEGLTADTMVGCINYQAKIPAAVRVMLVRILYDVSSALLYMHSLKPPVLHRDIKGSNVLIEMMADDEVRAKICDFGLSHHIGKPLQGGTLNMMAPEALLNGPATTAVDVFSFGRLTFLLATGHQPLLGMDRASIVQSARLGQDPDLDWPEEEQLNGCRQLANQCMQFAPENRISIDIVNDCLKQLLREAGGVFEDSGLNVSHTDVSEVSSGDPTSTRVSRKLQVLRL
eukprot:TRINITY_DN15532_c0_g1_i2.p1 TRINITY_DN15532_c0_g1~~TRINITY_DN15532_c0_g1_i2.p1  ORF type:complete len:593 (+),score=82.37 TRINITY_DN15532_c0_g1_i2:210-1781(+)